MTITGTRCPMVMTLHERIRAMPAEVGRLRKKVLLFVRSECNGRYSQQFANDLALVLTEACSNAVIHAYPGYSRGWIEVRARVTDGLLTMEVVDDGVGVGGEARSSGGGMGFALMQGLADVEVTSRACGGTRVRLTLPCR
ncbi:MAG TPA: ATP-binding protein [Gaiellales bacterium]|jgi:anti-sigma regulatory factor (Ser/Thr protein kinase)|nr:ATP-binding protein [Gaiellales bacterium]